MHTVYDIYTESQPALAAMVGLFFDSFTLIPAVGYWRGVAEQTTIIRVIAKSERLTKLKLRLLIEDIRVGFNQDCVLLTATPTVAQFVTAETEFDLS